MTAIEVSSCCFIILVNTVIYYISFIFIGLWYEAGLELNLYVYAGD